MFVAIFDLHAQYPVLSPFALSLGATPSFIGVMMGLYSATHIPGNILAGYGVDRYGSRIFIVCSMISAGILLLLQAHVESPWQLLAIRSVSGFVLAFLSPACLALLAKLAKDHVQQGKLMSGNGLVHTLASVVSPAAGALLVAKIGFTSMFTLLGWGLIITGVLAVFGVRDVKSQLSGESKALVTAPQASSSGPAASSMEGYGAPWMFYLLPLFMSCSQGILFFELPLSEMSQASILTSGILFSIVSLGALVTLSMLFLNQVSSFYRSAIGSFILAITFFGMAIDWPIKMGVSLFIVGMAKGVILPALSTFLASISNASHYGRVFAMLSISFSIGAFLGPVLAGYVRDEISPYFIAFTGLMFALMVFPYSKPRTVAPPNERFTLR